MKSLWKAAATVGSLTMLSRIAGFVRDALTARALGAGGLADAFVVAFRLPNFFRAIFAEGAFTAAFVPQYARVRTDSDIAAAQEFAGHIMVWLGLVVVSLTLLAVIFMPQLFFIVAPGFHAAPDKMAQAILYARIMFPYLALISLVALFGSVLNSHQRFTAFAFMPVLLNLVLIVPLVLVAHQTDDPALLLSWAVLVAGVVQLAYMISAAWRYKLLPPLVWPRLTPAVKRFGRLVLPIMLGSGVMQINVLVSTMIASTLPDGAVSYLYYADRLNQLPLGVIGIALGTALLPMLSAAVKEQRTTDAHSILNRAIELGLLLTLPAAAALMVAAYPILVGLFAYGQFSLTDAALTASALTLFASGLPAYVLVRIWAPAFFARDESRTPLVAGIIGVVVNISLNLLLMQSLAHNGVALANAIAGYVNAAILGIMLYRRGLLRLDDRLRHVLPRMLIATTAMVAAIVLVLLASRSLPDSTLGRLLGLALLVGGGLAVYALAVIKLGVLNVQEARGWLRRRTTGATIES